MKKLEKSLLGTALVASMVSANMPAAYALEIPTPNYEINRLVNQNAEKDEVTGLNKIYLKEDQKGYAGTNNNSIQDFHLYGLPEQKEVSVPNNDEDYSFWHFVDSGKQSQYVMITFETPTGLQEYKVTPSTKINANDKDTNQHYAMITPSSWKLINAVDYTKSDLNAQFNLSHSYRHEVNGKVNVQAKVQTYAFEKTPHEYYERTITQNYTRNVHDIYEKEIQDIYQREVQDKYAREVKDIYKRDVYDVYERYAQKYLIPVFTKKLAGEYNGTLVTRLNYSDKTVKATPTNGGAFKNGHTYVAVDVNKASSDEGVWYTIADSSKNNGKKTPDQYNRPIDYQYNVRIKDGKLIITGDERLAYASVGAYVYASIPKDAKNAPKHSQGIVSVELPKNCDDTIYLYTHFENIGWYEHDENHQPVYEFKEWQYDESLTQYGDYELNGVYTGDYAFVETEYGEYQFVNTKYGEYSLIDTIESEYKKVDHVEGDYELASTDIGEYKLVRKDTITKEIPLDYDTSHLQLFVDGKKMELGELKLTLGEHEFVLKDDRGYFTKTITKRIVSGDNGVIDFGEIKYHDESQDITKDVVKDYQDHYEKTYSDHKGKDEYRDHKLDNVYQDLKIDALYLDKEKVNEYQDEYLDPFYHEEYIYEEDKYMGSKDDPYGEYAKRLN